MTETAVDNEFDEVIVFVTTRGTWLCPRCEDKLCTHGELCDTCQAKEADYDDERALQEQLRRGG